MELAGEKFDFGVNHRLPDSFPEAHIDLREHLGDGIFLMKDGDLGLAWEIEGIYDENLTPDELQDAFAPLRKVLRGIVPGIPAYRNMGNVVVQVICSSRRLAVPPAKLFENEGNYEFGSSEESELLRLEERHFFEDLTVCARKFYLTLRYSPNVDERGLIKKSMDYLGSLKVFDIFRSSHALLEETTSFENAVKLLREERERIELELKGGASFRRFGPRDLMALTQNMLTAARSNSPYEADTDIEKNLYVPNIEAAPDGTLQDGVKTQCYHLSHIPREYAHGIFRHFVDTIPHHDFDIVWTFSNGSGVIRSNLKSREGYFESRSSRQLDAAEFRSFRLNVDTSNPYGVQSVRLLVHNPPEGFRNRLQSVANDYLGVHMPLETQIPVHMIACALPLNCSRAAHVLKGRARTIHLANAFGFIPIYTGPASDAGTVWRMSRAGTPTRFDLFAGEGNRNTTVLGTTRAGKSVLTNLTILEFLERYPDGIVRGTDVRTSYQKLCDLCGGRIVEFSEAALRADPYSPFAFDEWDEVDMDNLTFLVSAIIVAKNPDASLEGPHTNLLKEAIKIAYNAHAKTLAKVKSGEISDSVAPHPIWPKIVSCFPIAKKELEKTGTGRLDYVVEDLAKWTMCLFETGEYGFLFSQYQKPKSPSYKERILIYDLDKISDPVLRQIASMIASIKIMRDVAKIDRSRRKLIIIDELGEQVGRQSDKSSLAAQAIMGNMITNIVATAAKMNAQVFALTNQVRDYTENPAGQALWGIAEQRIFLPLGNLYPMAKKAWEDDFNVAEWEILKSLKKQLQYCRSMAYISSNNDKAPYKGSIYIPLSPSMDALTTSSGSQMVLYQRLRAEGKNPVEALSHMAEHHPYGEGLTKHPSEQEESEE